MNEQPKRPEQLSHEGGQQFYQPANAGAAQQPSQFSGYDLSSQATGAPALPPEPQPHDAEAISWEASEYVHHDKGALWVLGLVAVVLVFAAIAFFTQAWTFLILTLVMGVALGVIAFRPPRVLRYSLSDKGLQIDEKFYNFNEFKSFGVIDDGSLYSIMLIPTKRFMPAVNIYFEEDDGEDIVDVLGSYLPMQHIELDAFDKLMRHLRF